MPTEYFVDSHLRSECYWLLGLSNLLNLFEFHSHSTSRDENVPKFQLNITKLISIILPLKSIQLIIEI